MVYGPLQTPPPVSVDHPRVPIGEYSASKKALEDYCIEASARKGLRVSMFRPRLINGPGRVGILGKLFKLIRLQPAGADDRQRQQPLPDGVGVRLRQRRGRLRAQGRRQRRIQPRLGRSADGARVAARG